MFLMGVDECVPWMYLITTLTPHCRDPGQTGTLSLLTLKQETTEDVGAGRAPRGCLVLHLSHRWGN